MKEFEPSKDFTASTMSKVRAYEREVRQTVSQRQPEFTPALRWAMRAGGLIFGILNLVRLYFAVFAPAVCR